MVRVGFKTRKQLRSRRRMAAKSTTIVPRPIGLVNAITFKNPLPTGGQLRRIREKPIRRVVLGGNR